MNVDAGCLSVTNPIQISSTSTKSLLETTTSTLQHLITTLFTLPQKQTQDGLHATLPLPTTKLPRARKLPKPKPPTKWELFAKAKGIAPKKKKERWVHDAQAGIDRPAWGYKSKENDDMQDWLIEVPDNADPSVDVRQEVKDEKKKRIEKNKKQQIGNLERSGRMQSLEDAIKTTRKSTASLGKFDATLRNEPKYKRGEKRKFDATTGDSTAEQERVSSIVAKIAKKQDGESVVRDSVALKQVDASKVVKEMKQKDMKKRKRTGKK